MASSPQFTSAINLGATLAAARISTANTARDGSGTLATLVTGGTSGTRIDRIQAKATATTTAGMIRVFLADAEGTPNIRLVYEIIVTAITPTASVKTWEDEIVRTDNQPVLLVPSGWTLRASTHNAETFDVIAVVSGDF